MAGKSIIRVVNSSPSPGVKKCRNKGIIQQHTGHGKEVCVDRTSCVRALLVGRDHMDTARKRLLSERDDGGGGAKRTHSHKRSLWNGQRKRAEVTRNANRLKAVTSEVAKDTLSSSSLRGLHLTWWTWPARNSTPCSSTADYREGKGSRRMEKKSRHESGITTACTEKLQGRPSATSLT